MKQQTKRQAVCIATSFVIAIYAGQVAAQGRLTPPGEPAPTMKTLEQVEPRIPIFQPGSMILQPGSYYLTTNIISSTAGDGITIAASDVSLDLNGFVLDASASSSGNCIYINPGMQNVRVANGSITGAYANGIYAGGATNCIFVKLRISTCGRGSAAYRGLVTGTRARVERCRISGNTHVGLECGSDSKIIGNEVCDNGSLGLRITGAGTYIADNIIKGNGDNYEISASNQLNILLCEVPETLSWPCSVKFAGTLTCSVSDTNGITVNTDNVTINMDGHSLIGPGASSLYGIYQSSSYDNLRVYNGKTTQWKGEYKYGLCARGKNNQIENIQASENYRGIYGGYGCTISGCTSCDNDSYGIYGFSGCTISDCAAYNNGDNGISGKYGCSISACTSRNNSGAVGIDGGDGCTISGCTACNNGGCGISGSSCCTISDCSVQYNNGAGVRISYDCQVTKNCCDHNGYGGDGAGIHVISGNNRIDSNNVTDNDRGIDVDATGNLIVRNSASGNGVDYDIVTGNDIGTVQTTPAGAGAWDNFSF
jgi:parallel beta-helix repeat protein